MAGNGLIAAFLVLVAALSLNASHEAYAEKARDDVESTAVALRQALSSDIKRVDMALQTVRTAMARGLKDKLLLQQLLDDQLSLLPLVDSLRVARAEGTVWVGHGTDIVPPVSIADRAYFALAKAQSRDQLITSEPLQDRIGGHWIIVMARRLSKADGSFDGVVSAGVPVDSFRQRFAEVDVGANGAITLRTAGRLLVTRYAPGLTAPPAVGSSNVSRELETAMSANPREGFFVSRTAADGIERMSAYRAVDEYPLIVLVGRSTSEYFEPWRKQAVHVGVLLLLTFLAQIGASLLLYRASRREHEGAERLRLEGLRNRALLRASSDGVQVLDRQGRVLEVSDSLTTMLRCTRDDLLGQHVCAWDLKFSAEHITRWLGELPLGELRRFETRYRCWDGSSFDAEVQAIAAPIGDDELVYCSVRDVTERKRLTQELLASTERVRDLYDNAPCAYYSHDTEGRIVQMNATGLAWLGCTRDEIIGARPDRFLDEAGRRQFAELYPTFLREGRIDGVEFDLVPQSGETRRVRVSAIAIRDGEGRFVMSRAVMHDITELHRTQMTLMAAVKLEAENRQLRETHRVRRAFLSNVSHEMRTPLNAVIGFARLLRTGAVKAGTDKFEDYLRQIDDSGSRLLTLIEAVLEVAHSESARLEIAAEPTDVEHVINTVLAVFQHELDRKAISRSVAVDARARLAVLDPLRLEQAVASYVSNAAKFTGAGGHVAVRALAIDADALRIEVQDTGIGVAEKDLGRLFSDFQQLSEGDTKKFGGLGIGLALAKRIIGAQGGTVSVVSEVGVGSTFAFELPNVLRRSVAAAEA